MLGVTDLMVRAGNALLLDHVEAAFNPGRVTAIIGPNGAGKSTLMTCLAGLRRADAGAVTLDDRRLDQWSAAERARSIGYLPQDAQAHWNVTVRALVALGRFPHRSGMAGESEEDLLAIERALAAVDLMDLAARPVRSLSGGERARATVARVLAGEPRWILADEPLAALDIAHRYALMGIFRAIAAQGVGVVVVIHDLAVARRGAHDALLLDGGKVTAAGDARDVIAPAVLSPVFGVDFALARAADRDETLIASPALS